MEGEGPKFLSHRSENIPKCHSVILWMRSCYMRLRILLWFQWPLSVPSRWNRVVLLNLPKFRPDPTGKPLGSADWSLISHPDAVSCHRGAISPLNCCSLSLGPSLRDGVVLGDVGRGGSPRPLPVHPQNPRPDSASLPFLLPPFCLAQCIVSWPTIRLCPLHGSRQTCDQGYCLAQAPSMGCLRPRASVFNVFAMGVIRREQVTNVVCGSPTEDSKPLQGPKGHSWGWSRRAASAEGHRGHRVWIMPGNSHQGNNLGILHHVIASYCSGDLCGIEPVTCYSL